MAADERPRTPRAISLTSKSPTPRTTLPPIIIPDQPTKRITDAQQQRLSLSPKEVLHGLASRSFARSLTGAVALTDERLARQQKEKEAAREAHTRVSHNQAVLALNALVGHQEMSKPSDAPAVARPGDSRPTGDRLTNTTAPETTPPSRAQPNATAQPRAQQDESQMVEEPESMEDEDESPTQDHDGARAFTYPGSGFSAHLTPSRRDNSVPASGSYDSGSKSAKRHKCPHCDTDFTRHHNLKSHLLTHSQEKPYVCQTCSARFRRLHDLKRHAKLHTGERPHICPKCGRKFARGDALARHNKGPGGCANRKSSFGADDDGEGDDTMDLEYDDHGDERGDDSEMLDDHGRRVSEPISRKRTHAETLMHDESSHRHARTYPPPLSRMGRQEPSAMGPPPPLVSPTASRPPESQHDSHYPSPYYPQAHGSASSFPVPITESPRPISPKEPHRLSGGDAQALRNASPSMSSTTYQTPHYGPRNIPSSLGISAHLGPHGPQLPSLPSLTGGPQAVQPHTHVAPPAFPQHHTTQPYTTPAAPLVGSNPGSHSSHGHSSTGSLREILVQDQQDLYSYVRTIEGRMSRMQDEYELRISRLQAEVIDLKTHVYQGR